VTKVAVCSEIHAKNTITVCEERKSLAMLNLLVHQVTNRL